MDKGQKDFELVKESGDRKKNYIFKKDGITKRTAIFVIVMLVLLIGAVVYSGVLSDFISN